MTDIVNGIIEIVGGGLDSIVSTLSNLSPFVGVNDYLRGGMSGAPDWLRALNWFIPMGEIVTLLEMWGAAILIWYGASIVLRWLKAVE